MPETVIPITPAQDADNRRAQILSLPVPLFGPVREEGGRILDARGRPLRDLRISVTDHCNFRCRYCMPREKFGSRHKFLAHTELLTFEEILKVAKAFARLGVEKIRLTGGEPLLRRHIEELVAKLKEISARNGAPLEVCMTTNASILARKAQALKAAGLDRVTVSLDALNEELFQAINDVGFAAADVIKGIEAAQAAGLSVKVNTVVKRRMNEGEILPLAEHFRNTGVTLRFIEYMDAGTANGWRMDDVVPTSEIVKTIGDVWPMLPSKASYRGEVADRWHYLDGAGEVGFISSVTQAFCRDCTRARLSVEGGLFLCLFADRGYDIRTMLRGGASVEEIEEAVARIWTARDNHYSEIRSEATVKRDRIEMQYIGG